MEKRSFDPWTWGKNTNSVQAVEVKQVSGTLYCSGQAAINADGTPSHASMRDQFIQTIANLEQLVNESGYACKDIVRLNVYTTSTQEFFSTCIDLYTSFIQQHSIQQATTLLEVNGLFATLTIELEATVVK